MVLGGLYRHRRLPAVAALVGVLLYTGLATNHTVSQATLQLFANAQSDHPKAGDATEADCHDHPAPSNISKTSNTGAPASPQKKCPFCSGYANLHIAFIGGAPGPVLPVETAATLIHNFGQDFAGRAARTPQNRGPPPSQLA